jgi:dTDP-glucose 4,6-dehydratase
VVVVRPFNTYGPRQSARAVIPTIITQAVSRDRLRLGSLTPTRDFNYVADTVAGFLAAAAAEGAVGEVFNLGTGKDISIGELAGRILKLIGRQVPVETADERLRPAASEVMRLVADAGRARRLLGWAPAIGLDEGLSRTIAYIRDHLDDYTPDAYVV